MQVSVYGEGTFEKFAIACDQAAGPDFDKHMDQGLKDAGDDLGRAVLANTDIYMPSGYDAVFRSRVQSKTDIHKGAGRGVTVTVSARGRTGRRDVQRLERGLLRHPIYGRIRVLKAGGKYAKKPENIRGPVYVNPWDEQRIRPHFFSEPVKYAAPQAIKRLDTAVGRVLQDIGKAS